MTDSKQINGIVKSIIYKNESSEPPFVIMSLKQDGQKDKVTVLGNMPIPTINTELTLFGKWEKANNYGWQFKFNQFKEETPNSKNGIVNYIASAGLKGIGEKVALKIFNKFGTDSFSILDNHPEKLVCISGITKKNIPLISEVWNEKKESREIFTKLQEYGISPAYCERIYRKYKSLAVKKIEENPYILAYEVDGIGFLKADVIAKKMNIPEDSEGRILAGILYVLKKATESGNMYLTYAQVLFESEKLLKINNPDKVTSVLNNSSEYFIVENFKKEIPVYITEYANTEDNVATKLVEITQSEELRLTFRMDKNSFDSVIDKTEKSFPFTFAIEQKEAIKNCLSYKVNVITGRPGTGKTTIVDAIIHILQRYTTNLDLVLCAPTGKAAKRLSEVTGHKASTIHRLLPWVIKKMNKYTGEEETLSILEKANVIIVDEFSMVDTVLMNQFLKCVKKDTLLIFVGDINQLPSIGPGYILGDMMKSGIVNVTELIKIQRQAKYSSIKMNSHKIIEGIVPDFSKKYAKNSELEDLIWIEANTPEETLQHILNPPEQVIRQFNYKKDVQILTPMKKTIIGIENLNNELQRLHNNNLNNPTKTIKGPFGITYAIGDKVTHTKNNYTKGVFNGDSGIIVDIRKNMDGNKEVIVNIDNLDYIYTEKDLLQLQLSYAITIHRSQGSEFPCVIMPISTSHWIMLQRNLIYTGLTRAQKLAVIIGSKQALYQTVKNNPVIDRNTGLKEKIKKLLTF